MMTLKLAWRNIWRNGRRTLITAAAIGLGVAALVFTQAMVEGMFHRMVGVATASMSGDAQIHAPGYRTTQDERLVIPAAAPLLDAARALPGAAATPRVFGTGLVAIGDRSQGVRVIGVAPDTERRVTNWAERLTAGRYLEAEGEALVGAALARKMDLELDTRLVLTMADIETG
ncbi:MAG: ABC transporter permease, partial [bacterium]